MLSVCVVRAQVCTHGTRCRIRMCVCAFVSSTSRVISEAVEIISVAITIDADLAVLG